MRAKLLARKKGGLTSTRQQKKATCARTPQRAPVLRVGVDTGGTFTDFIYQHNGELKILKLASTPADPSVAIISGLRSIADETQATQVEVVHGTTVGTNALLERRGARTALVTTAGFEDVIVIGRQARPSLYDLNVTRPAPLVCEELRYGVRERIAADGEVLETLTDEALAALVRRLRRARVESIAVSLLFSFVNPEHENRIKAALAPLGVPLSISHEILPAYREYERTSTVVVNAYLQPLMSAYLLRLAARVPVLRVMQSAGGSITAKQAAVEPVRTILSGPAGGVIGALRMAGRIGAGNIITFDMGGTSTDVALCAAGRMSTTTEAHVSNLPVAVPMLDIHTVGAGGGSIARVDRGGSLRVGPQSAGADPGPACYGRGALPTVTDANLALNRFGGAQLLGGDFPLDAERARVALSDLAALMSAAAGRRISATRAALGVISVINAGMERALRIVSIERGYDPREFALVSFGGAGGLHAVELARALGLPRVIIPSSPGALSGFGALVSDIVRDQSRTVMIELKNERRADERSAIIALKKTFRELKDEASRALAHEGFAARAQRHEAMVAARYKGQSFELEIAWDGGRELAARFHRAHLARYGYSEQGSHLEIVNLRLRSSGLVSPLDDVPRASATVARMARRYTSVRFSEKPVRTAFYERRELKSGTALESPCIIAEYSSTTLVPPQARAGVDREGNIIIEP